VHDPGRLGQPAGGSANYYSEVADRAGVLAAAVLQAGLGEVLDVGLPAADAPVPNAVTAVHEDGLIDLLRTAWADITAEGTTGSDAVVVAETFPLSGDPSPGRSTSPWAELGRRCADTSAPLFEGTWRAALGAAVAAVAAADDVAGGARAAYALCRPPGHHAGRGRFGGFCYLNNSAAAAEQLSAGGARVAVVDVDLHHGNGTQDVFWERPDVLYVSIHVDPDVEYPFFAGFADERGGPGAEGTNLNLPLPEGSDETPYLEAVDAAVRAVGTFGADALVVSLGTDTHRDDPIGRFALETSSYPRIGERLAAPGLPTVVVQEGGYHLATLGQDVVGFLAAFR
jgi:acetoin utilization deacetylase AcuC-like enzyme